MGARSTAYLFVSILLGLLALVFAFGSPARAEVYTPGIWIDPDGCEHWVMDDGAEGYMSPRRTRDGRPVCRRSAICGIVPTDTMFAAGRADLGPAQRQSLQRFFAEAQAYGVLVHGHTDSSGSDAANMALSTRRAEAVADVARAAGTRVVDVTGYGERQPRASNATAEGMRQNRRVELYCLR
ncbi:OmpA family protein [Pseudoroseicyclus aestuarii]|uniref:OmpA family protein n=1 Tax=Pseudoroseicyclus aestuarii TaxID=1795041 RepID=A0A318SQA8_9RHOB|nr:OmpA family protein [Pseudoroseicyclus aestuarii]PYE84061.1 OmpA family protein [Pseudoroseicyclus aestuarii]